MIYDWTLAKKCNDWVKLIQHGAEERHAGEEVGKSESEEDDDVEDCDDTQLIEVDDSASSASSEESFQIEDLIIDSEPFLPQKFGLIEDPGVIRIDNVDYVDVFVSDKEEIISYKQSISFIDNLCDTSCKPRQASLRFSKSLNDVRQDYDEETFFCLKWLG